MKKHYFTAKISFLLAMCLFPCLKSEPTQASTLLFDRSQINQLILVNSELKNRRKTYSERSIAEIIRAETSEDDLFIVLEPNSTRYNQKTGIELLTLPLVSRSPNSKLESTELVTELSNTLSKLNWNRNIDGNNNSRKQPTVLILPQADSGDVYRNIYDFEISLIDENYVEKPEGKLEDETELAERKTALENVNNNLTATHKLNYNSNYDSRFNFSNNFTSAAVELKPQTNPIDNNLPTTNIANFIKDGQQLNATTIQHPNLPQTKIEKYQIDIPSPKVNSFNIPRTKEQQELDRKLAEQRENLEKQRQELRKKLEQYRKERERKRQQEEQRLRQKRQDQLRKARQEQQRRQQELRKSFL